MPQKPVSVVVDGIRGYGLALLSPLLDAQDKSGFELVGAIARNPDKCERIDDLRKLGVKTFTSLKEFYAQGSCDLMIISTPIHLHLPHTVEALANGSNVLCEKPLAATIQEGAEMIRAREKYGKWVAIGYDWSFATAILDLKRDIQAGLFGKAKRLRTLVMWPRYENYYARGAWAGVIRDDQGNWVLDSPVNNATAHYLHNMFYVLGEDGYSARPVDVQAELYRAKSTENYDTGALRCHTENGVEILFFSTHAVNERKGPVFTYEFEQADILFDIQDELGIVAHFKDGRTKNYVLAGADPDKKIWDAISYVNDPQTIPCGIEAASSHTLAVNGAQESSEIVDFPPSMVKTVDIEGETPERTTYADGLSEAFDKCYEQGQLPSEAGIPWGKAGRKIDLQNYKKFPGG